MKKVFVFLSVFFVLFISFAQSVCADEFERLYSIKNSKSVDIKFIADFYSRQANMLSVEGNDTISKVNISDKSSDFFVMSFVQTSSDTYFYFFSPEKQKKITKDILKRFKLNGYKYKKIRSKDAISIKRQAVKDFLSNNAKNAIQQNNSKNVYDFSDEAQQKYDSIVNVSQNSGVVSPQVQTNKEKKFKFWKNKNKNKQQEQNDEKTPVETDLQAQISQNEIIIPENAINIPQGTIIPVVLQSTINSASLAKDDRIAALLQNDLYLNQKVIAEAGSIVYGSAKETKSAGAAYKNGSITLHFDKILTANGEELSIATEPLVFANRETHRAARITGSIIGGVLVGVAGAALSAAIMSDPSWAFALSAGAIAGAVGGGLSVISSKGEEMELSEGQVLQLVTISVR